MTLSQCTWKKIRNNILLLLILYKWVTSQDNVNVNPQYCFSRATGNKMGGGTNRLGLGSGHLTGWCRTVRVSWQEVCNCDTVTIGYSTRSYKMYKTQGFFLTTNIHTDTGSKRLQVSNGFQGLRAAVWNTYWPLQAITKVTHWWHQKWESTQLYERYRATCQATEQIVQTGLAWSIHHTSGLTQNIRSLHGL